MDRERQLACRDEQLRFRTTRASRRGAAACRFRSITHFAQTHPLIRKSQSKGGEVAKRIIYGDIVRAG